MKNQQTDGSDLLLREFADTWVEGFFFSPLWGLWLALAVVVGTLITLLLGHFTPANSIEVTLHPQLLDAHRSLIDGPALRSSYGYLLELNHGLFYLALAPAFVLIGSIFIRWAGIGIANLERCGYLKARGKHPDIRAAIDRLHRYLLFGGSLSLPILMVIAILSFELYGHSGDYRKAATAAAKHHLSGEELGYTESPLLSDWLKDLEDAKGAEKLDLLNSDLKSRFHDTLLPWILNHWSTLQGANSNSGWTKVLKIDGQPLGNTAIPDHVDSNLKVDFDVKEAMEMGLLKFTATGQTSRDTPLSPLMYWAWFIANSFLEGAFIGYVGWVGLKIIWWLSVIGISIHPSDSGAASTRKRIFRRERIWLARLIQLLFPIVRLRFEPLIDDPQKRFGLSELSTAYNAIAALLVISATVFTFSVFSNNERGNFTSTAMLGLKPAYSRRISAIIFN